jgi:hypothetical protein
VTVGVVQSGNHCAAAGVDHLCRWSSEDERFCVGANHHETIAADRHSLRVGAGVVDGVDTGIHDHEIGRQRCWLYASCRWPVTGDEHGQEEEECAHGRQYTCAS